MDAFEQIWETSRHNSWSWFYPATIWFAVAVLIALSFVRKPMPRRILKTIAILAFGIIASEFSAREIQEKWRLRGQWAETHKDQMTEAGWEALTVDGANLTLGPVIYGFQAMFILVCVAFVLGLVRLAVRRQGSSNELTRICDDEVANALPISSNPYHPPQGRP